MGMGPLPPVTADAPVAALREHLEQLGQGIRNRIEGQSLPMDVIELDFCHLADNVHKARRVADGEEAEQGQARAAPLLHTAKHEGYGDAGNAEALRALDALE